VFEASITILSCFSYNTVCSFRHFVIGNTFTDMANWSQAVLGARGRAG
jgi:hypothetical protein